MDRRLLVLIVAAVALIGVVNATAFAYRRIEGRIDVLGPENAAGIACVGFYSSAAQRNIGLPEAGTNHDAKTIGAITITVTPSNPVCTWSNYNLYEGISVKIPITNGTWYIKDFYGFGYYSRDTSDPDLVYVTFTVSKSIANTNITSAILRLRDATNPSNVIAQIDLITGNVNATQPLTLNKNNAWKLDLIITATGTASDVQFRVDVYVSPSSETP
jgi:hypothetical protein